MPNSGPVLQYTCTIALAFDATVHSKDIFKHFFFSENLDLVQQHRQNVPTNIDKLNSLL